jgi:hypothetical protein
MADIQLLRHTKHKTHRGIHKEEVIKQGRDVEGDESLPQLESERDRISLTIRKGAFIIHGTWMAGGGGGARGEQPSTSVLHTGSALLVAHRKKKKMFCNVRAETRLLSILRL